MVMRRIARAVVAALASLFAFATLAAAPVPPPPSPPLERFLAQTDVAPEAYRALRRLDAQNDQFHSSAWMDVWTEADRGSFQYRVVAQGGSDYIRSHVFLEALERERKMWVSGDAGRGALNPDNYVFADRGTTEDGLVAVGVKPRRRDVLLVDGAMFVRPEDGELVRVEGRLAKSPSFWARRVDVVRRYDRIAGIRLPVELASVANLLVAGRSTFHMTYEYESVNGWAVGTPVPRVANP
jgi:hypothetical protein